MKRNQIKSTGSWYQVKSETGQILNGLKGKFRTEGIKSTNPVVVGDKVKVEEFDNTFMIIELYDRKISISENQ